MTGVLGGGLERPSEALTGVVTELEELLQEVINDPAGLVQRSVINDLALAWADVQPLFDQVRDVLRDIEDAELARAGLIGAELTLKLNATRSAIQRARNLIAQVPRPPLTAAAALAIACGFVNVIIKSLPIPLLTERIEEFKSIVEKSAEAVAFVVEEG